MTDKIVYNFGIPAEHGGDSEENVVRLEKFVKDLGRKQPWLELDTLIGLGKKTLFPDERKW